MKVKIKNYKEAPIYWDINGMMLFSLAGKVVEVVKNGNSYQVYDDYHKKNWYVAKRDIEEEDEMIIGFESALVL
jgi:hypothetical protein